MKQFLSRTAIIPLLSVVMFIPVLFMIGGNSLASVNLCGFNLAITNEGLTPLFNHYSSSMVLCSVINDSCTFDRV
jgi:hypothetical protein